MSANILSLSRIKEIIKPIALKYKVKEIYLFGSYARGEATDKSDLDFLVFGGEDFKLTLIFSLAEELREAFQKNVDVFEIHEVNQKSVFYDTIMKERLLVAWNTLMNSAYKKYLIIHKNWLIISMQAELQKISLCLNNSLQWLVTTPLYNIGEHAYSLSKEYKDKHSNIPWAMISGLRHRLVHDYDGTNWSIISDDVFEELPELIQEMRKLI